MVFLRMTWTDPRLADPHSNETLTLASSQFDKLWVPDLFVKNAKREVFHDVTLPNRLLYLDPNGTITYSQRYLIHLLNMLQDENIAHKTYCWFTIQSKLRINRSYHSYIILLHLVGCH